MAYAECAPPLKLVSAAASFRPMNRVLFWSRPGRSRPYMLTGHASMPTHEPFVSDLYYLHAKNSQLPTTCTFIACALEHRMKILNFFRHPLYNHVAIDELRQCAS